jgi:hypothetical protein
MRNKIEHSGVSRKIERAGRQLKEVEPDRRGRHGSSIETPHGLLRASLPESPPDHLGTFPARHHLFFLPQMFVILCLALECSGIEQRHVTCVLRNTSLLFSKLSLRNFAGNLETSPYCCQLVAACLRAYDLIKLMHRAVNKQCWPSCPPVVRVNQQQIMSPLITHSLCPIA